MHFVPGRGYGWATTWNRVNLSHPDSEPQSRPGKWTGRRGSMSRWRG